MKIAFLLCITLAVSVPSFAAENQFNPTNAAENQFNPTNAAENLFNPTNAKPDYETTLKNFRKTLEAFVAADTTNPPGNEAKIVKIASARLKDAGIPFEVTEFAPGRQNLVARLKGKGTLEPVLIMAHTDVVGTKSQNWTSDPRVVTEKDGYLIGRGVADDLGMASLALELLIQIKKSGQPLKRDIILALTGDEESGGAGLKYLLKNNPSSIDAAVALNEGGAIRLGADGKPLFVALQVGEKTYQDYSLTAKGPTGHSSVPQKENAIYRLSAALQKISNYKEPARLIPVTQMYLKERSQIEKGTTASAMKRLGNATGRLPAADLAIVEKDPGIAAALRTTCVATLVSGGTRVNSLPAEASATLNCRILPDETGDSVVARLKKVIKDDSIEIKALDNFDSAPASSVSGELVAAVRKVTGEMYPGLPIIPTLSLGATDSRYLRKTGMDAYGLLPFAISEEDSRRMHGADERIPVSGLRPGVEFYHRILTALAGA